MPLIVTLLIVAGLMVLAHVLLREKPPGEGFVIGHRGAGGLAPENTLAALRTGIEQGARAVEVDVHQTADGVLVVMHDPTVERTTDGSGAIAELTLAQIDELDAGAWFGAGFAGERVPTLDAVLDSVAGQEGVTLYIEVKDPDRYASLSETLAETLRRRAGRPPVVVISFDHDWLVEFHELAPDVSLGALGTFKTPDADLPVAAADLLWISVLLDPALVARLHRRGWRVLVWTVNRGWQMRLLRWLGVDGITTDYPDRWQAVTGPD